MTFNDRTRVQKEVTLGTPPPPIQSAEELKYREAITREVEEMKSRGVIPVFPCDWEAENL